MGGKSGGKMPVSDYYMSIHYGLCHGPIDELLGIYYGEKLMWQGSQSAPGVIPISKLGLLGGPKKEGGVEGVGIYLPGGPGQVCPQDVARKFDEVFNSCPGFRGVTSIMFTQESAWDGTYPSLGDTVGIPASGTPIIVDQEKVGFKVSIYCENSDAAIPAVDPGNGDPYYPKNGDSVVQASVGVNHDFSNGGIFPDQAALFIIGHAWEDVPPHPFYLDAPPSVKLRDRFAGSVLSDGTDSVSEVIETTENPLDFYVLYDGVTGLLSARMGTAGAVQTKYVGQGGFILFDHQSDQLYGDSAPVVSGDISDPFFPADTNSITEYM